MIKKPHLQPQTASADPLQRASEQVCGKKQHEIKSTVLQTLEGHLRAILGETKFEFSGALDRLYGFCIVIKTAFTAENRFR